MLPTRQQMVHAHSFTKYYGGFTKGIIDGYCMHEKLLMRNSWVEQKQLKLEKVIVECSVRISLN